MKSDFLIALTQLAAERHLPKEQVLQAIEVALASAFKKDNPAAGQNISVKLNPNTGDVSVYALKTVVEAVEDPTREISLPDAQRIKRTVALGEEVAAAEPLPHNASRIAAQTAKQVVLQRLREVERERLYEEFLQHQEDIVSGVVEQVDANHNVTLDLGRAQALMLPDEQVPTERYRKGQRVKVFVVDVRSTPKGPEIMVSRSHRNLLKRLFEIEVPEVYNGVVEIMGIAREGGYRSKVAVNSTQPGIDPVGSCIGIRGNRIQSIVNELQGEKIDVVPWDSDAKVFIAKAISPSEVSHVELDFEEQAAIVVVPDRQLSLAIGKEGQNARLAARLTGWRLDIKGLAEWEEIKTAREQERKQEEELAALIKEEEASTEAASTPAQAEAAPETAEEVPEEAEKPVAAEETAAPADETDDEALLEALIKEEEDQPAQEPETVQSVAGISVDELATFTLEKVSEEEEYAEEEEEEGEEEESESPDMPVLTPDAGKIRFAEDIVGEFRGGGRRDRKSRRGSDNRGGRRGGGRR